MSRKHYTPIILSLHPEWWELIKTGKKLLEIRKNRPRGNGPYRVLVYCTGNVGVVGEFECDCFYCFEMPLKDCVVLPEDSKSPYTIKGATGLSMDEMQQYARESGKPLWGWHIRKPQEYLMPLSLPEVEAGKNRPPQSWRYAKF